MKVMKMSVAFSIEATVAEDSLEIGSQAHERFYPRELIDLSTPRVCGFVSDPQR